MQKSLFAIIAAAFSAVLLSTSGAYSAPYPFGDEPYWLNWGYEPGDQSGCLRWNWQQHGWDDYCPIYIHPKAFIYPPASRGVLRTRG